MTIEETALFLASRDGFILSSHESPDADGLGAEYALATALAAMGKRVSVVNAEPYSEAYGFIDRRGIIGSLETSRPDPEEIAASTAILLDTNDVLFAGEVGDAILAKAREVLVIDHHEAKGVSSAIMCSLPSASSTCEMVYRIVKAMGCSIEADAAAALFAGIVYDTGSFAYSKTSAGTFEASLDLVRCGAEPSAVHSALYESSAVSVLFLRKAVLATLELHAGDRIATQTMTSAMIGATGSSYQDAEGLINIPLQAAAVEVSLFFKENEEGTLRCSLRSKGGVNVAQIAQSFGGGGHKSAAGFKSPYPLATIRERVLELVTSALPARSP